MQLSCFLTEIADTVRSDVEASAQAMKASHRTRPTTPCSSRMRPYSFSRSTGSRIRWCRKYGALVPPPPRPLPIG